MPIDLFRHIFSYKTEEPHLQTFTPSPDLRSIIDYFFLYTSEKGSNQELAFSDGVPWIGLMLDKPNTYCFSAFGKETLQEKGYLSGLWLEGIYIKKPAHSRRLLGVRFTHEGLYHLLKEPISRLRHQISWSLEEIFGETILPLLEVFPESVTINDKIKLVEKFIRQQANTGFQHDTLFIRAAMTIRTAKGQISIYALAKSLGINYKWLERKFKNYTGIAPKEYARLIRFIHAYFDLQNAYGHDIMGVAIYNGFYDQNHFIKEFKKFTNHTPLNYLKKYKPQ